MFTMKNAKCPIAIKYDLMFLCKYCVAHVAQAFKCYQMKQLCIVPH